jgi:hypothetical protein
VPYPPYYLVYDDELGLVELQHLPRHKQVGLYWQPDRAEQSNGRAAGESE